MLRWRREILKPLLAFVLAGFLVPAAAWPWETRGKLEQVERDLLELKQAIEISQRDRGRNIMPSDSAPYGLVMLATPMGIIHRFPLDPFARIPEGFDWFRVLTGGLTVGLFALALCFLWVLHRFQDDQSLKSLGTAIGLGGLLICYLYVFKTLAYTPALGQHTWGTLNEMLNRPDPLSDSYVFGITSDGVGVLASKGPDYEYSFEASRLATMSREEFQNRVRLYDVSNGLHSNGDIYLFIDDNQTLP